MKITVEGFADDGEIPSEFTGDGEGMRPAISWEGEPVGTQSFALSVIDYDVPKHLRPDGIWHHWLVANIPPLVHAIPGSKAAVPGEQVKNSYARGEWGGPCPPDKRHRYFFTIYALNIGKLTGLTKDNFTAEVEKRALAKAQVIGTYERK